VRQAAGSGAVPQGRLLAAEDDAVLVGRQEPPKLACYQYRMRTSNRHITTRSFGSASDLMEMHSLVVAGRARSSAWHYPHSGELAWAFFMVDCHLDPREHVRLWHSGGRLVGYAILGEDPSVDWHVLPEYEWSGIESDALQWARTKLSSLRQQRPVDWTGTLTTGAHTDDLRRIAFLHKYGFRRTDGFAEVNMLRSLGEPIPTPVAPAGIKIISMSDFGDVAERAAVQREVWHPWTVGNVSNEDYARLMAAPAYRPEFDLVAVTDQGTIASYVNCWVDGVNQIGDFGPLGARAEYRRLGITRALLWEGLRRLEAAGMDRACVSTGVANWPAIRLYESLGFRAVNSYYNYLEQQPEEGGANA